MNRTLNVVRLQLVNKHDLHLDPADHPGRRVRA